jgi:integrating conjugative element membrane protein (TIGR03747 family)
LPPQPSLSAKLVLLPFTLFGVLCGSLLLSVTVECVGVAFFWPEQGEWHAREMLDVELEQFSENFTQSLLVRAPGRAVRELSVRAYDWVFVRAGWRTGCASVPRGTNY